MAATDETSSLLLARHGQSTWNAEGRWQGQADPPLSTLGVRQAKMAADTLGGFDLIVASPLQRALTTATIIAEALGVGPVQTDPDLMERHAGEYQGLTRAEIEERFPGDLAQRRHPPGWEDDDVLAARTAGALGRIAAHVGAAGTALVVTHGGVIRTLERLVGADRSDRLGNLHGRWFTVGRGVLRAGEDVLLVDPAMETVPDQI